MIYGLFLLFGSILKLLFELLQNLLDDKEYQRKKPRKQAGTLYLKKPVSYDLSGLEYEQFVASKLWNIGFTGVKITKGSGDFGADILANKNGRLYCIQCKKYSTPVGIKAVQEVYAAKEYYKCDCAMVITTSEFTSAAKELADKTEVLLMEHFI